MQHICSSVNIKEIYFTPFVVIFLFESRKNTNNTSEVAQHFFMKHKWTSFMKYISRNIRFLFHSVRCPIEINWFVASHMFHISCNIFPSNLFRRCVLHLRLDYILYSVIQPPLQSCMLRQWCALVKWNLVCEVLSLFANSESSRSALVVFKTPKGDDTILISTANPYFPTFICINFPVIFIFRNCWINFIQ